MQKLEANIQPCMQEYTQAANILNRLENRKSVLENLVKEPFNHQHAVRAILDAKNTLDGILGVVSRKF